MQTFKKALVSALCFVSILTILSVIIIEPFLHSDTEYYMDAEIREELVGSLDFLITGSSHGMCGFYPEILDRELKCSSYNLGGSRMTLYGRNWILKKELERNPVKTVVVDVSYDTLSRDQSNEYMEGDTITIQRLGSFRERLSYLVKNIRTDDWLNYYSRSLEQGMQFWRNEILGKAEHADSSLKGILLREATDITLSPDDAVKMYNQDKIPTAYRSENIEQLKTTISLCKSYGIRVIVAVVPYADSRIWKMDGWDYFHDWLADFCNTQGCEFYDFDLLKNRYEIFNDQDSFYNETHLSIEGAEVFTKTFCEIMKAKAAGEDVSGMFYNSYTQMKQNSPYMKYVDGKKLGER